MKWKFSSFFRSIEFFIIIFAFRLAFFFILQCWEKSQLLWFTKMNIDDDDSEWDQRTIRNIFSNCMENFDPHSALSSSSTHHHHLSKTSRPTFLTEWQILDMFFYKLQQIVDGHFEGTLENHPQNWFPVNDTEPFFDPIIRVDIFSVWPSKFPNISFPQTWKLFLIFTNIKHKFTLRANCHPSWYRNS